MPQMDGTEVLYEIRKIEQQRNISKENQLKVIMVTAQSDKGTVITCMQAGCDSYVVKPFDRAIIAKRLEELGMAPRNLFRRAKVSAKWSWKQSTSSIKGRSVCRFSRKFQEK